LLLNAYAVEELLEVLIFSRFEGNSKTVVKFLINLLIILAVYGFTPLALFAIFLHIVQ